LNSPRINAVSDQPLSIGLLTTYLAWGNADDSGIGQHYRILADALTAQGHQVCVVHPSTEAEKVRAGLAELAPPWRYVIVPVHPPHWLEWIVQSSWTSRVILTELCAAFAANQALAKAVQEHSIDIIETHATSSPALFYLQRRKRPSVITRVSTTMSQMNAISPLHSRVKRWQAAIERFTVRSSNELVTHTERHRDSICQLDGYDPSSFAIIPHGLPDIPAPPVQAATKTSLDILFVGRFEHRKGIDVLLSAIPEVLAVYPNARFTLVGDRGDNIAWETFLRENPEVASRQVVSTARVSSEELEVLYERCDIFVAPSRYESFGLIYVEAMRHAKPVIGCNVGGVPDVVQDGITGLLTQPDDVTGLVACLNQLSADEALRKRLGQAGRVDFLTRFSADQLARASTKYYREILTGQCEDTLHKT